MEYLIVANITRREYVQPHNLGSGQKHVEIIDPSRAPGGPMAALWHLLWPPYNDPPTRSEALFRWDDQVHGRWVGGDVRVLTDESDRELYREVLAEWTEISDLLRPVLSFWCAATYIERDGHWYREADPNY
jgi:hypothetical protein